MAIYARVLIVKNFNQSNLDLLISVLIKDFFKQLKMGCAQSRDKQKNLNVLVVGLDQSGKTTFLYTLDDIVETEFYHPTQSLFVYNITRGTNSFTFNEVGGRLELRSQWDENLYEKDGIFFFVDVSDEERIHESLQELKKLLVDDRTKYYPFFIFFNKTDKISGIHEETYWKQVREVFRGKDNFFKVYFISCLTRKNIEEGLNDIIAYYYPKCVLQQPRGTLQKKA